jgi:hypothetical protein
MRWQRRQSANSGSETQRDQIHTILLEGFKLVRADGRIGDHDKDTAARILAALDLDEGATLDTVAREVGEEVLRAFGNFAESLGAFYRRELERQDGGSQ